MTTDKATLRQTALARRAAASATDHAAASARLKSWLRDRLTEHPGTPVAGYHPMRGEADPRPALSAAAEHSAIALPVITAKAQPLRFRQWLPDAPLIPGTFGAMIPETGDWITPQIVITPLVAFDTNGARLGYGGGFYDRTLAQLRARRPTLAVGFALDCQNIPDLPQEPTDEPLDLIITNTSLLTPT